MGRGQDKVGTAFAKHAYANSQNKAVSMFCQGVHDQEVARMTANQAQGDVASAPCIAASATAFRKEQRYSKSGVALLPYHEFVVVNKVPIDMLIGGVFLRRDKCEIMYKASSRDAVGNRDGI